MNSAFYFQHDYNASNDAKVLFLRQQLGMEGYGIYWFILEQLAQSGGYLPFKIIPVLAMQCQTQEVKVKAVIEKFDLFQIVDEQFFSARMVEHLAFRKHLSEKGKKGAELRWNKKNDSPPISPPISDPNAKERKGKERKEKESIVSRKQKFAHTLEPYLQTYGRDMLNEFYAYWTEPNKSNTQFRQEQQKAWDLGRRLATWAKNDKNFKNGTHQQTSTTGKQSRSQQNAESVSYLLNSLAEDMQRIAGENDRTEI